MIQLHLAAPWTDAAGKEHNPDKSISVDREVAITLVREGTARIPDDVKVDRTLPATSQILAYEALGAKASAKAKPKPKPRAAGSRSRTRRGDPPADQAGGDPAVNRTDSTAPAGGDSSEGDKA